jgi:prevent-host-death family protein
MPRLGVRELKNQATEVIRNVREKGTEYVVTYRGDPVAIVRPLTEADLKRLERSETDEALAKMKTLAGEIAAAWRSEKSGVELVSEQRR